MNAKYCCLKIYTFLLLGLFFTMPGCKDDATGPGPTGKINVSGKVIDVLGNGIINATISIGDSIKTTDANGSFSISDVTSPYDAKIIAGGTNGFVYKGLTTTSPQFLAFGISAATNTSTLNVTIPALVVNQRAKVIFTDQTNVQASSTINFPATVVGLNVNWPGGASLSGKIIVLVYTLSGGHITTYDKYGEKSGFTLNNGGVQAVTFTAAELTLNPGESTITGALTLPAGFASPANSLGLKYSLTTSNFSHTSLDNFSTAAFNFVVPTGLLTANLFVISGIASTPAGQSSFKDITAPAPTSNLNVVLETPPSLTTPPNAATNIDTNTSFTYTAGSGTGIYLVRFSGVGRTFYVITPSTTTNIPNLNSFGLGIGSSIVYAWSSLRFNGINSTDEFVSKPLFFNTLYTSEARSETRTFTTAP